MAQRHGCVSVVSSVTFLASPSTGSVVGEEDDIPEEIYEDTLGMGAVDEE